MVPAVQDSMEGCPPSNVNLVYLILSALLGLFIFLVVYALLKIKKGHKRAEVEKSRRASMVDAEFQEPKGAVRRQAETIEAPEHFLCDFSNETRNRQ